MTIIIFSRLIVKPIRNLSEVTSSFGQGNYSQRVKVSSNDEIGHLANNFNEMAKTLEASRKNLEKKVTEKTKELEDTMDDFYTVRLGMEKDIKKGNLEKENKKIKARIGKLKKKK